MKLILFSLLFCIVLNLQAQTKIELPSIFSDNMVLQQKSDVNFWGKAEANLNVTLTGSWGEQTKSEVKSDGTFALKLKTPKAGGPYTVSLQIGNNTITYRNVLIGEVWICSGQSNMEMPLMGWPPASLIDGSDEAIKNANNDNIRLFTVTRAISVKKENNCTGNWDLMTSTTAANFSATAFFFGTKLYNELKVPIGLIHTSWGGTPAEAWTDADHLQQLGDFNTIIEDVKNSEAEYSEYTKWLNAHRIIDVRNTNIETRWQNLNCDDDSVSNVNFDDSNWKIMKLPGGWEASEVGTFDGIIWFRKKIQIPDTWINQDLVLNLGPIDDCDRTFVNGKLVGAYEKDGFWQTDRIYKVAKELVQSNELVISVRVTDTQGGGGLWGIPEKLNLQLESTKETVSLVGEWKYLPVAEYREQKFYVFGVDKNNFYDKPKLKFELSPYSPTTLYNAMINPLVPYNIKGAIWYQGEANTGNPNQYQKLFPMMIQSWRDNWQLGDFPFYYVQIAPYNYGSQTFSELLREAQFKSLSVKNSGMVVTLDIGNPNDIHPSNKKDVGERLAFWALAKTYNKKVNYSGPVYKSMKVEKDKIKLTFDFAKSGLVLKELNGENNFMIAGSDKVFKKAKIKIDGNKLIVFSDEVKNPVAVRYAFTNISEATLFNKFGLPSSSFRIDDWEY
jgi:sialate O-acetylesterase